jgi:hypothetical protein
MVKHDQSIQDPKRRGRDNEHVDRHSVSQVVVQKAAPSRGRGLGVPRQIPPDCGLTDIDAEVEQFAVDARCPPERVSSAHPADQVTDFGIGFGSSRTASSQSPVDAEALAMPCDHSRRFDEYQRIEEMRLHPVEPNPEQAVGQEEPKAAGALPPENDNLMAQGDELKLQRRATADAEREQ